MNISYLFVKKELYVQFRGKNAPRVIENVVHI
jgi:hypothetical protein